MNARMVWCLRWVFVLYALVGFALSQDVEVVHKLPFTQEPFSPDLLHEFALEGDINQMIRVLREDYGIKVLIFEEASKWDPPNPELRIEHPEEDLHAINEYERALETWLPEDHIASYWEKYSHPELVTGRFVTKRPYREEDVIVLRSDATSAVVLHEFHHYLIHRERAKKTEVHRENGRMHFSDAWVLEVQEKFKKIETLELQDPQDRHEIHRLWLEASTRNLMLARLAIGEEYGITRYQLDRPEIYRYELRDEENALSSSDRGILKLEWHLSSLREDELYQEMERLNVKGWDDFKAILKEIERETENARAWLDQRIDAFYLKAEDR